MANISFEKRVFCGINENRKDTCRRRAKKVWAPFWWFRIYLGLNSFCVRSHSLCFWPSFLLFVVMSLDWCVMPVLINKPKKYLVSQKDAMRFASDLSTLKNHRRSHVLTNCLYLSAKWTRWHLLLNVFLFEQIAFFPPPTTHAARCCVQIHI